MLRIQNGRRQRPCQRVNRPLMNPAIKQVNVIIIGIRFRGSIEFQRVMEEGNYQVHY